MKHFKGPWYARRDDKVPAVVCLDNLRDFIHVVEDQDAMANAQLIATSPCMLDCLEHLVKVLRSIDSTTHDIARAVDYAQNVIRKAKGE
jgi:hypothetical protein